MNKLKVGDVVILKCGNEGDSGSPIWHIGRIVSGSGSDFAVEFPLFNGGHTCCGDAKYPHGWYVHLDRGAILEKVEI